VITRRCLILSYCLHKKRKEKKEISLLGGISAEDKETYRRRKHLSLLNL